MHNPEPVYPFDTIMTESWWVALNMFTTRFYVIPPALGMDQRIVNGYLYISPNSITDPGEIARRAELFTRRAGHYYENWNEIYDGWVLKAEDCIRRLVALEIADLPEVEAEADVFSHRAIGSSFDLLSTYNRLIENMQEMACYHFEMLGLGYAAYLTFREFCQRAFPGISDQTIAQMVGGIDILFFRPDDEVRKLARLAIELDLAGILEREHDPDRAVAEIGRAPGGARWVAALEEAKDPWFWYSTGPGYSHEHRAWMDDMSLPFSAMRGYIEKLAAGEEIERPLEAIRAEGERIFEEYRELVGDADRDAFVQMRELARTVYPFVENHNFYVEHWHHSIFWNRVREFGRILAAHGFLEDAEDIFFLHRFEVHDALYDLCTGWATGTPARGPSYWPPEVAVRKQIMDRAAGVVAAARTRRRARGRDRAVHRHALRRDDRHGPPLARQRRRSRGRAAGDRRLEGSRGRAGARDHHGRRAGVRRVRRDPRLPDHGSELGAGLRQDRRRRLRHRRDHVPRRDRLARVRPARGRRHGVRDEAHHDRPADPGRRRQRRGHDPRVIGPAANGPANANSVASGSLDFKYHGAPAADDRKTAGG